MNVSLGAARGTAIAVLLASLAIGAPSAYGDTQVTVSGWLAIAWHGDPARGCAQSGLCGVSGALQAAADSGLVVSSGTPPIELQNFGAVARVNEQGPDGSLTQCADVVPVDFSFRVARAPGTAHARIDPQQPLLPLAGHCAGPREADLSGLRLPAHRSSDGWNLAGTTTFGAGPFEILVRSTLRARFSRAGDGSGIFTSPTRVVSVQSGKPRRVLLETVEVSYRVASAQDPFAVSFGGSAPPLCEPLGACGMRGTSSTTFTGAVEKMVIFGERVVRRPVSRGRALADLRAGRLRVNVIAPFSLRTRTTATAVQGGSLDCRDLLDASVPVFSHLAHGRDLIVVDPASQRGEPFDPSSADLLRTRCPGPSSDDVLGGGPLASASIPISEFGDRQITLPLSANHAFRTTAYQGRWAVHTALRLTLRKIIVRTTRIKLYPGEPL